jgi:hypothetical protein
MKFVQRTHYCKQCAKKASFFQFATKKTVGKDYDCPRCGKDVVSFWEELNNRFVLTYFIGVPFFAMSAIYGFWTSRFNQIRSVDIFVILFNVIMASFFTVYGIRYSKLKNIPNSSDKSLETLKLFRKQTLFSFLFTLAGFLIATVLDILLVLIWLGIEGIS